MAEIDSRQCGREAQAEEGDLRGWCLLGKKKGLWRRRNGYKEGKGNLEVIMVLTKTPAF